MDNVLFRASMLAGALVLGRLGCAWPVALADEEQIDHWSSFAEIALPAAKEASPYYDLLITPEVFAGAQLDLADLRLRDAHGRELPYALRIRMQDVHLKFDQFNSIDNPGGSIERTLDLQANPPEHNCVDIHLEGSNFRRAAKLEGSDDHQDWRPLAESNLISFRDGAREFDVRQITYPASRFRYLRLQIQPDPTIDKDTVRISELAVLQRALAPAEFVTRPAKLSPREPAPTSNGPGSRWVLDLGGDRIPVDRINVDVTDDAFARDYQIEAEGRPQWRREAEEGYSPTAASFVEYSSAGSRENGAVEAPEKFLQIQQGLWRRLAGATHAPLVASFTEQRASRLRLCVTDNRNPPLNIESVTYSAPARQLTFANTDDLAGPLRLYFGNAFAKPPQYDFQRNLPAQLTPLPFRLELGSVQPNPQFTPLPLPFSERWPGLVYFALGTSCVAVGLLLVSVGRQVIAGHDASPTGDAAGAAQERAESISPPR